MQTTKSAGGTAIGFETRGDDEQLVLVHGSTASHRAWGPHRPHLADAGELIAMDRRGRGASDDVPDSHALDREIEGVGHTAIEDPAAAMAPVVEFLRE